MENKTDKSCSLCFHQYQPAAYCSDCTGNSNFLAVGTSDRMFPNGTRIVTNMLSSEGGKPHFIHATIVANWLEDECLEAGIYVCRLDEKTPITWSDNKKYTNGEYLYIADFAFSVLEKVPEGGFCKDCRHLECSIYKYPCDACCVCMCLNHTKPFYEPKNKVPQICEEANADSKWHDAHYQGTVQPIEAMQSEMTKEEFEGFLRGNIVKYALRFGKKDDTLKEAQKILRYAQWLVEAENGNVIDPRKD